MLKTQFAPKPSKGDPGSTTADAGPDLSNLTACVEEVRQAILSQDPGPPDPTHYEKLREELEDAKSSLPPSYQRAVYRPYLRKLDELGPRGFRDLVSRGQEESRVFLDVAQCILQKAQGTAATKALQEVACDLYDGFVGAADRAKVDLPTDTGVLAPLVKWGRGDPYSCRAQKAAQACPGFGAPLVSFPRAFSHTGLLVWAIPGHEAPGHDITAADAGLTAELRSVVGSALQGTALGRELPGYWSDRIEETVADVLNVLNMGPAAAVGLIGFLRGRNLARVGEEKLSEGDPGEEYAPDILRGCLVAAAVGHLEFGNAGAWALELENNVKADFSGDTIVLDGPDIKAEDAKHSAGIVAETLVTSQLTTLGGKKLGEIQNWRNQDEQIVGRLRPYLTTEQLPAEYASGIYAAHLVAAAVTAAVAEGADLGLIFRRMVAGLATMHDANAAWKTR